VNTAQPEDELAAVRRSVRRGCPFGDPSWLDQMVRRLGSEMTLRPQGWPRTRQDGP
jgi:putative transposase